MSGQIFILKMNREGFPEHLLFFKGEAWRRPEKQPGEACFAGGG